MVMPSPSHALEVEMTWLRRYVAAIGAAAILGALASLAVPLHLDAADRNGRALPCGTGLRPNLSIVTTEDQLNGFLHDQDTNRYHRSDYIGECAGWILRKRHAALFVGATGALTLASTELLMRWRRTRSQPAIDRPAANSSTASSLMSAERGRVMPIER